MIANFKEYIPQANEPLFGIVQRMAYVHFLAPLPPEQLAPDSYIKLSLILDGEPRYFDGYGQPMDWHDGFSGHVPPRKGIIATSEGPVRCLMVNFFPALSMDLSTFLLTAQWGDGTACTDLGISVDSLCSVAGHH